MGRQETGADGGVRLGRRAGLTLSFVPEAFEVPSGLTAPSFRLAPLGPEHNERDHAAWTQSIAHIRATPGFRGKKADAPALQEERNERFAEPNDFNSLRPEKRNDSFRLAK